MDAYEPDLRTSDLREEIADETIRTLYDTLRKKSGLSA
jgi:hypothetical protein